MSKGHRKATSKDISTALAEIWSAKKNRLTESVGNVKISDSNVVSPGLKVKNSSGRLYVVVALGPDKVVVSGIDDEPASISQDEIVLQNPDGRMMVLTKKEFEDDYKIQ